MNLSDLPTFEPSINELMQQLNQFCEEFSIVRFEADDIKELLEDGEEVDWIVGQLQQDNADLDASKLTSLLTSIQGIVGPEEIPDEEAEDSTEIEAEEPIEFKEAPTEPIDLSQIDLSQMGPELEALTGMKLPQGIDMNQIKKIMESPQGAMIADFSAFCQEQGIDMENMSDEKQIQELNEQWMSTPREAFGGKTPAEASENDPSMFSMKKVETYRREAPRIGRNDPCPCGSGKKYKKCCGKGK